MTKLRRWSIAIAVAILLTWVIVPIASAALEKPYLRGVARSTTATLSWDSVSGAARYKVYIISTADKKASFFRSTKKTNMTIKNMRPGTDYTFAVRVEDVNGVESPFSNLKSFTTGQALKAPRVVKTTNKNASTTISWNRVSGADKYWVFRLEKGARISAVQIASTTNLSYRHSTSSDMEYAVVAVSAFGDQGEWGATIKLDKPPTVNANPKPLK